MLGRMAKDETYVIDLCDRVLRRQALRQHRFEFLRGDAGHTLPVDAYYPDLNLVVEYRERQHFERVPFFDKRVTVSGIPRGPQRALYDQRRRNVLPQQGITLVELCCSDFPCNASKRLRRVEPNDERVMRLKLARWLRA